jgi:hypothetical protein
MVGGILLADDSRLLNSGGRKSRKGGWSSRGRSYPVIFGKNILNPKEIPSGFSVWV